MNNPRPRQPAHLSPYARACLGALVKADLARHISLGGAFGLFHYFDYRSTHDVDAWWSGLTTEKQKQAVAEVLTMALSEFGRVSVRSWGDVVSVELIPENRVVFSFQIAARSARLQEPVSAEWIEVPLDSLPDLVAAKMVALVERGAPRDFLDIYSLCEAGLLTVAECWSYWHQRQILSGSDADVSRARLAIETHLERITLHRPLEKITDAGERERAQRLRDWFFNVFLPQVNHE